VLELVPWGPGDLGLLQALNGSDEQMRFLGGAETTEKIAERNVRYATPGSHQYKVVAAGEDAGWVGFWPTTWQDGAILECGWSILPAHQGKGAASAGMRLLIAEATAARIHRHLHAFPKTDNDASAGVARKAGFALVGEAAFEYPPGHPIRVHDFRLALW
jgi:RimJ/RimL family protein N-acetyltransferase